MTALWSSLQFLFLTLAELFALFLGISTLVGLALQYISKDSLQRWLQRKWGLGYLSGAGLGALTPFCSCSTIPMTVGLLRAGVPFGATMSFLLASPLLNPIILAMILALLGWKACVAYGATTFILAVITGAILSWLGYAKYVRIVSADEFERAALPTFAEKLRHAFAGAWHDLRGILPFLLIGVAVGAAIHGYVPSEMVVRLAGPQNPFAIPVAAIIGVPLYVRGETIIPVALALVQKGMSMGAVIALIIGGAGMSIPEMSMLAGILKPQLVVVFVVVVFLAATLAGLLFQVMLA